MSEAQLKPGWLKQELDAASLACAPPAAGPWIKIEQGCEMPESGIRVLLRFRNGEVWCATLYRHAGQQDIWQWHCDKDPQRGWTGYQSEATHYAIINQPEGQS